MKPLTEYSRIELQKEYIRVTNEFLAALKNGESWEDLDEYRNQIKQVIQIMDAHEKESAKKVWAVTDGVSPTSA
jgi:hypothetical protein